MKPSQQLPTENVPKACAIIPARGGSKGIPRKNIANLCGKPLIAWTIQAAQEAEHIDRVVISTDDAEIANVASEHGAEVLMRPHEISGDNATSEQALLHCIDTLKENDGYDPEIIAFLQCTSPLTIADDIDGMISRLVKQNGDSGLAVGRFHHFVWDEDDNCQASGINHDASVRHMRQSLKPQYLELGSIYVMKTAGFREHKHRFFGKTVIYETPAERSLELDEPIDFKIAETLIRHRLQEEPLKSFPKTLKGIVFDFDGVFTDNNVTVNEDGVESVVCNRSDGMGVGMLRETDLAMLVLSKEKNPVVKARCQKLDIPLLQGIDDKPPALMEWCEQNGLTPDDLIYVGNDINDVECLQLVGCGIAVADALDIAKQSASLILENNGGDGAVREVIDLVLEYLKRQSS